MPTPPQYLPNLTLPAPGLWPRPSHLAFCDRSLPGHLALASLPSIPSLTSLPEFSSKRQIWCITSTPSPQWLRLGQVQALQEVCLCGALHSNSTQSPPPRPQQLCSMQIAVLCFPPRGPAFHKSLLSAHDLPLGPYLHLPCYLVTIPSGCPSGTSLRSDTPDSMAPFLHLDVMFLRSSLHSGAL